MHPCNPEPCTLILEPQTPNTKPQTPNLKLETPNPKPQTLTPNSCRGWARRLRTSCSPWASTSQVLGLIVFRV